LLASIDPQERPRSRSEMERHNGADNSLGVARSFFPDVSDGAIYLGQQEAITFCGIWAAVRAHWPRQFLSQFLLLQPTRIRGRKNIKFALCSRVRLAFDISYDAVLTQTWRNWRNGRRVYFRSVYVARCNISIRWSDEHSVKCISRKIISRTFF